MISQKDKSCIIELAQKYKVQKILLFGSSASPTLDGRDIDLAVKGIAAPFFFKFYGELLFSLSKPVDLVDLDSDTPFSRMVAREGVAVYG